MFPSELVELPLTSLVDLQDNLTFCLFFHLCNLNSNFPPVTDDKFAVYQAVFAERRQNSFWCFSLDFPHFLQQVSKWTHFFFFTRIHKSSQHTLRSLMFCVKQYILSGCCRHCRCCCPVMAETTGLCWTDAGETTAWIQIVIWDGILIHAKEKRMLRQSLRAMITELGADKEGQESPKWIKLICRNLRIFS